MGRDEEERKAVVLKAVEDVNGELREWERVGRERVFIFGVGKRLPVTVKGNVKRREAEELFWGLWR